MIPFIALILFIFISGACPSPDASSEHRELKELITSDSLVILPSESGEQIMAISLFDSLSGQMTLSVDQFSPLAHFEPGQILAMGISEMTPQGLLQRIQSVSMIDGRVVYYTRSSHLAEAITKGRIQRETSFELADIDRTENLLPNISFQGPSKELNFNFSYHLDNAWLYKKDNLFSLKASGDIAFNLTARISKEIKNNNLVKNSYIVKIDPFSSLVFEKQGNYPGDMAPVTIASHILKPLVYSVSGFPVIELLEIKVYLDAFERISVKLFPLNHSDKAL
ncbi:MAG: hypothetical protein JXR70_17020 [Spirochaetales bacterium]|nr:hypothetical protein [Spirochaetales bacterium]